ncbi:oligosaccharide flippase family protein, partial [bacterium]|nr:oligosaccharide flippase family protein [bacterium]
MNPFFKRVKSLLLEEELSSRIFINSVSNYLRYLVLIGCQLWMIPFLIQELGNEEFGLWILVWSQIGLLALMEFGLNTSQIKFIAKTPVASESRRNLVQLFMSMYRVLSLFSFVLLMSFIYYKSGFESLPKESFLILIVGVRALVIPLYFTCYRGLLFADQHIWICCGIQTVSTLFYTGTVALVISLNQSIYHLAVLNLVAAILEYFLYYFVCKLIYQLPKLNLFHFSGIQKVLTFSVYAFLINVAGFVLFKLDPILIDFYGSLKDVSIYAIALKITENL